MIWRHNRIFFVDQLLSESVAHERHHDERAVEFEPEVFERVELIPEGEEAHDNFRDEEDPEDSLDDLAHDSIQALADDAVGEQPDLHTTVESMQRLDTGTSSTTTEETMLGSFSIRFQLLSAFPGIPKLT